MGVVELVTGIYGSASRETCVCVRGGGEYQRPEEELLPPLHVATQNFGSKIICKSVTTTFLSTTENVYWYLSIWWKKNPRKKTEKYIFLTQRTSCFSFFKPVTVRNSIVNLRITKIFFLCLKMQQTKMRSPKLHKITQWISMITNKIKMDIFS